MNKGYEKIARDYMARHAYTAAEMSKYLSGFDLARPVYEQRLDPGEIIFQFVRRPSQSDSLPKVGNWFALSGAKMGDLGINSGGSGRSLVKVEVKMAMTVLESTAGPMNSDSKEAIGGMGGATQIFIPTLFLTTHLEVLGYVQN